VNIPRKSKRVPSEGSPSAKIAIVGEAPGSTEVNVGRPFVGPAGGVLDECLHAANIIRDECYITNLFKYPVAKRGASFYIDGVCVWTGTTFTQAGMEHVNSLAEELEASKANVIVPLGNPALTALCGVNGIGKYRGSILESTLLPGRKCIPALHPAALLHQFIWRYLLIFDLKRIKEQAATPLMPEITHNFLTAPQLIDIEAALKQFKRDGTRVAVDIEVVNQEISCLGIGTKEFVLVVPFTGQPAIPGTKTNHMSGGHYWSLEDECIVWRMLAEFLEDPSIGKVFQNGLFDMWMLAMYGIIVEGVIDDTMVGFKQVYPDFQKNLALITSIYTMNPFYKDEFKIWANERQLSKHASSMEILWKYNAQDVESTWIAMLGIDQDLTERELVELYQRTMSYYPQFLYLMLRGIRVDVDELKQVRAELVTRENELTAELHELAGRPLNPRSSKQLQEYFYEHKKIPPYKNRKTGKPAVDDDALKRLARGTTTRKGLKEAALIREIRSISKLRSTYLDVSLDKDNRLRCSVDPVGTKNGRLSTSKTLFGNGMNMQNLPQQFRRFLKADPGKMLFEIDKEQGEWVLTAYYAGDRAMINVIEERKDAHTATAHLAFGVPEELIKEEQKIIGHETDPRKILELRRKHIPEILQYQIPGVMSCRQAGKKSNHGLNYDMGYKTFALVNEMPENEARAIVRAYHEAYPAIRSVYHAWVRECLAQDRSLVNVFGRRRYFYDRWGDALFKDGYAFPPQSALVDLVNMGWYRAYNDVDAMRDAEFLMQIHDSLLGQYPVGDWLKMAEAILYLCDYLNPVMQWNGRSFQIRNGLSVGLNWGESHTSNPQGMTEVPISDVKTLAEDLEAAYNQMTK